MLNERERRDLARIETHLVRSDPEFARMFTHAARRQSGSSPRLLLIVGLSMLVLGTAVMAVPIALGGMVLSVVALFASYNRTGLAGFSPA